MKTTKRVKQTFNVQPNIGPILAVSEPSPLNKHSEELSNGFLIK